MGSAMSRHKTDFIVQNKWYHASRTIWLSVGVVHAFIKRRDKRQCPAPRTLNVPGTCPQQHIAGISPLTYMQISHHLRDVSIVFFRAVLGVFTAGFHGDREDRTVRSHLQNPEH